MKKIVMFIVLVTAFQPSVWAEGRSERKARERAESEQPKQVSGGLLFAVPRKYDDVYEDLLTFLKKADKTIETASKETGQIFTAIEVSGGWKQTGTRYSITVIKEKGDSTSVRVSVTKQKRYKALQVEPWGDPVIDQEESAALKERVQAALLAP